VAVSAEPPSINRAFLESNSVPVDAAVPIQQSGIVVQMTPFLIVVRKDGSVISSWAGQLSASQETQVLAMAASR
jgi:hypothetical protein